MAAPDNILITLWLHFDYILATFWLHSDYLPTTFRLLLTTFQLHSGYILSTCWLHSGYIVTTVWLPLATFLLHSDYFLTTFDYILTRFWLYSDYFLTTFWLHSGYILATSWLLLTTFWLHSDYILTTFWLHSGYIPTDLIFVTNLTNIISGEKIVMWKNFSFPCMTIVGKLKISPHVEKFQMCPHDRCGEIWNSPHMACAWCRKRHYIWKMPQYTRFHVEENWAQKYMCGEKMTNIMSAFRLYSDYILTTFWLHSDRPDICH